MSKFLRIWLETGAYIDSDMPGLDEATEADGVTWEAGAGVFAGNALDEKNASIRFETRKGVTEYVRADAIIRVSVLEDPEPEPAEAERPVLVDRDGDTWVPVEDGLYAYRDVDGPTADRRTRERIENRYGPLIEQGAESARPGALLLAEAFDAGARQALRRVRKSDTAWIGAATAQVAQAMNVKIDD